MHATKLDRFCEGQVHALDLFDEMSMKPARTVGSAIAVSSFWELAEGPVLAPHRIGCT